MSLKNWFLLVLLAAIWGGSFFFIEIALENIPPLTLVFLRVSLAAAALIIYIKATGMDIPWDIKIWTLFFVMGLLNNAIPFSLIASGQVYISGGMASILNATTPIFTMLLAHFFTPDERLTPYKTLGVLAGFSGVTVIIWPTLEGGFSLQGFGQFAVICAAVSYALSGVWGKRMSQTPPLLNAAGMLICSSLIMVPVIFTFEAPLAIPFEGNSLLAIGCLALLSTALAYLIFFHILAEAGATNILLVTLLAPISAMVLGGIFLGETLSRTMTYGIGIIAAGLILIDGRLPARIKTLFKHSD